MFSKEWTGSLCLYVEFWFGFYVLLLFGLYSYQNYNVEFCDKPYLRPVNEE